MLHIVVLVVASNQLTLQKKKLFRTARGRVLSNVFKVCGCAEISSTGTLVLFALVNKNNL